MLALVITIVSVFGHASRSGAPASPPGSSRSVSGPFSSLDNSTRASTAAPAATSVRPAAPLTLKAVPATAPYRSAPASFSTVGFLAPDAPPACDPTTLSLQLVDVRTISGDLRSAADETEFSVAGRGIGAAPCILDSHGLAGVARDRAGATRSQPTFTTADGRPSILVDPGDVVSLHGSWPFTCSSTSGPLTLSVRDILGSAQSEWPLGVIPAPGPISTCPDIQGGGPSLSAVSAVAPGSLLSLDAQLSFDRMVPAGGTFSATATLTNRTTTPVRLTPCPDFVVEVIAGASGGSTASVHRVICPAGLVLAPGEAVVVPFSVPAPPAGTGLLVWNWYQGSLDPASRGPGYGNVPAARFLITGDAAAAPPSWSGSGTTK